MEEVQQGVERMIGWLFLEADRWFLWPDGFAGETGGVGFYAGDFGRS
jgi:hypothetical protein